MDDLPTTQSDTPLPYDKVTVWHLEMLDAAAVQPSRRSVGGLEIIECKMQLPEFNRFLYAAVGGDWYWRDRLTWDYARWMAVLGRRGYETWVAYLHGTPAGYFELDAQAQGSVEIAYFGLLPQFLGRGIGGILLTRALERAWQKDAARVWVHTCSLDHPSALRNYEARGLQVFKTEHVLVPALGETPGAWPGAQRPQFMR